MSISSDITRIKGAKADLKTAINAKGGTLTTELIDDYAAAVDAIPTGTDTSSATATASDILTGKTAYISDGTEATGTCDFNADTTDATLTAADMLYGKTGYAADGLKKTGLGALWEKVKELRYTFNGSTLEEAINVYAPNAILADYAFQSSKFTSITLTLAYISRASYAFSGCNKCVTITMTTSSNPVACFSERTFNGCAVLTTIDYTFDCTNVGSTIFTFGGCVALVTVSFVPSTIKLSLSFINSPLLSTTSLLSIANGIGAAITLTLHETSKTNCDNILVDNVGGVAVLGSAMTLSAFITGVKGATIA